MFCRNCGKEVNEKAVACPGCGVTPLAEKNYCHSCGTATQARQVVCVKCGVSLGDGVYPNKTSGGKSKVAAGILALIPITGELGIHDFYLGKTALGVIHIILFIFGCLTIIVFGLGLIILLVNWIWAVVEGIMIFTDAISKDASGQPLI